MKTLLIVDDSSTMRKIIKRVLRQAGISPDSVLEASNGIEGLQHVDSDPDIELVLSDVNMPQMNGLEFVKAVRIKHSKEQLPVVMITTEGGDAMVQDAVQSGANGYVTKPFTPATIRSALERFVE